jgi:ligand-binding sensor domain-containing protein/signal transduction histidine kinase/CheY-like chemotaxis protein
MRDKAGAVLLLVLVIGCLIFPPKGFGQRYYFKNYSVEDGLAHSDIYTVFQDSKGYLWIGYYGGGLDRFDGKKFVNFTVKDGLSNDVVTSIVEDKDENLWIGTHDGICKYNGRTFTSYTQEDGLIQPRVSRICPGRDGYLWVALYLHGVSRFDTTRLHFKNFTTVNGLIDNDAICILVDSKENVWIGTAKGVSQYNGTGFVQNLVTRGLNNYTVQSIFEDGKGNLWFGTTRGVFCFDGKTFTHYTQKEGLVHDYIRCIMEDSNGILWFGTIKGVSRFDWQTFSNYTTKNGLCYDSVEDIREDREGNLWIGTRMGISKFRGETFTYLGKEEGLKDNVVWSIWQNHDGVLWIGTEKGIAKFYGRNLPVVYETSSYLNDSVYLIYGDKKDNIWFSTSTEIIKSKGGKFINVSQKIGISNYEFLCILEDKKGNIWFGTQENGVIKYDGKAAEIFTKKDGLLENEIAAMIEDLRGNLWFGTSNGISIYNDNTKQFVTITPADGLNNKDVVCMAKDRENNIWIGTYGGGVNRYTYPFPSSQHLKKGKFETFTSADGLIDDEIISMVFDNAGNLWVGTNRGISSLDVGEFKRTGKKIFKNWGKDDGFISIEANQNAVYKDNRGNLWFGTIKGAVRYNPKEDRPNTVEPATYITDLKFFLEKVDWNTYARDKSMYQQTAFGLPLGLELPYKLNHLTFYFIGISLTAPGRVRYRVKLEGFDENWSPVLEDTHVTYSNLSPGDYVFKVKARGNNGLWNKEPAVYRFKINSPFWRKWWFYMMIFVVGSGGLFGFIRIRLRKLKKQKQVLEEQIQLHTLELKKEKAKVDRINLELEQRVEERTRKLEEAHGQLMQAHKMEAIGTLAGGVAHDLNNVLAGIVSYPELMLLNLSADDPLRKPILTIQRSGEKAAAIVQDMLCLARRGINIKEALNLNPIISEFMQGPEVEKILCYHTKVQMEVYLDEHLPDIMGSSIHLTRMLMNLVSNAAEAMPEGGEIIITTKKQNIIQPVEGNEKIAPGDYAVLIVSDMGIGISKEEMEHMFEPFYTKRKMGRSGTGLGMSVVWGTVEEHKGHITVQSEEGKGTTFTLHFPAPRQKSKVNESPTSIEGLMGDGETILVVDDVEEQKEATSLMLKQLGYSIAAVSSGEAAVAYVKDHPMDLVVLDMIMDPGISGLETYKRILQLYPDQKAIIVSGFSETEEVKETQRLGGGTYVKKPYGIIKIGMAVKNELNKKKQD